MTNKRLARVFVSTTIFIVVSSLCAYAFWWRPASERATCRLQLRNYNQSIASCGMDLSADEAWKDPETTKILVERLFQQKVPECPSGGTYSIVYGKQPHTWLPTLVCSLEVKSGHIEPKAE